MYTLLKPNTLKSVISQAAKTNTRLFGATAAKEASFKVQDDKDFLEKVENSKEPVIVDFFANWCGPCKALEPRLENIIAKKKVTVAKVDIDSLTDLAEKYEVCMTRKKVGTIPALVVFKNGKAQDRLVGLQDEDKLSIWVDKVLEKK